jgi:cleavage and polyadenylation specificity factor subunit 1
VVVVTSTGIIHVDQSGRKAGASVNGWWERTTATSANTMSEGTKLSLEGSRAEFVSPTDMLLVLQTGDAHQVRFEMDGRAVGAIKVDEESSALPPPSTLHLAGKEAIFVGCAEGDSVLAKVDLVREAVEEDDDTAAAKKEEMELDWDEDLYGEADGPNANGTAKNLVATGPATITLTPQDVLAGIGRISDIEFGIAVTDQAVRTYPQLVALGGGSNGSTINVFRRGIPITKRRRFEQLATVNATWFLPVQRPSAQKFKGISEAEQTTVLFASDGIKTRIFALSAKTTQDQIGHLDEATIAVGTFFNRSSIVHVSPTQVVLMDSGE